MPTLLIVNADDFGLCHGVNAAVLKAWRAGVLTSASLMVTGNAAGEAVRIAKENPDLAVGLHVALSDARSALCGSLMDNNPVLAGVKLACHSPSRRKLRAEIEAQFDAFAETGLELSHVDGHQHLHAHPAVLPIVIEQAIKHGASGIRVPRDPVWLNLKTDASAPAYKACAALGVKFLTRVCEKRIDDCGLTSCDYSIGCLMSGMINAEYAVRMLASLDCRSVELYCHPTIEQESVPFGPNRGDFDALVSRELKRFLATAHWKLTTYAGLPAVRTEATPERA